MSFTSFECKPSKDKGLKCIVRVSTSTYRTKQGYSKRIDIRDLKRKSDMCMSDIFVDSTDVYSIENLDQVEDGVYELIPASVNYGTYEYPCSEVETWKLIKVFDND